MNINRPNVWWVEMSGGFVPTFPAYAYPLIAKRDKQLLAQPGEPKRAVAMRVHNWNRPDDPHYGPDFDPADCWSFHMDLERASHMAINARADSRSHPLFQMQNLYARCAAELESAIHRLRRVRPFVHMHNLHMPEET